MSIDEAKRQISSVFPTFRIHSISRIEDGWDSIPFEINGQYIFKFPKDADSEQKLRLESKVLNTLKGKITTRIPEIEFEGTKQPFIGYRKIQGVSLTTEIYSSLPSDRREQAAEDIAEFLYELHTVLSEESARKIGVPKQQEKSAAKLIEETIPAKIQDASVAEFSTMVLDAYGQILKQDSPQAVLHADLHVYNIAFDAKLGKLNGVFDFSDVTIGDVHRDFYSLYPDNRSLWQDVIRKYESRAGLSLDRHRIEIYAWINYLADLSELIESPESPAYQRAWRLIHEWIAEQNIRKTV